MKVNLESITIDDLLGSPRNRNAGAFCRHYDNVPVRALFEITNVSIVRQDLRPQLQVRGRFEDCSLRCVHNNGIDLAHSSDGNTKILTRTDYRCRVAAMEYRTVRRKPFERKEKKRSDVLRIAFALTDVADLMIVEPARGKGGGQPGTLPRGEPRHFRCTGSFGCIA